MKLERMLADALREEAESRDVDVARLWADTRGRLERKPPVRRKRWPVVAAAAAAAAVVVGVGVVATVTGDGGRRILPAGQPDGPVEGEVADEFTCPEQVIHDWTRPETVVDKYFVATFGDGVESQARVHGVPTYELEVDGDRAYVDFGNKDGSLAMRSEFHRKDGEWVPLRSAVCSGVDGSVVVPVEEPAALRNHLGDDPLPPADLSGRGPVLVDHRAYYTSVGVMRSRTLYAGGCRTAAVCLSSVEESGDTSSSVVRAGPKPRDLSYAFLPNDAPDWRTQPFGMWAVYDADDAVAGVTYSRGNMIFRAERFTGDAWPGSLYLVVAPFEDFTGITVTPPDGPSSHYPAEELPPYGEGVRD